VSKVQFHSGIFYKQPALIGIGGRRLVHPQYNDGKRQSTHERLILWSNVAFDTALDC
jgi:hypothetical protein